MSIGDLFGEYTSDVARRWRGMGWVERFLGLLFAPVVLPILILAFAVICVPVAVVSAAHLFFGIDDRS